ncbi:ParB/RepB/Spo0J family partition protein [Fangia hongkongensis]|uniref:ParB/RepB/Spo0J family partition protein n=1 Tax=Fangia hongkongensis TaxID=270495 RepID=UPI000372B486|nr:ParB/RepB/Spo0J family partition protein [Fangia hongkongensis]MBK2125642.1 ParB/RepB/Spo0J family partition protein [Fangia hongkongensis]
MSKISLSNRKRISDLNQKVDTTSDKKDELLALQLQEINQEAERANLLKDIILTELLPDPNQPRKTFRNIDALAKSIEENGIIQPIIVTPKKEDGFYHIIAGERRFRAAKQAGLHVIPCILREEADSDILILQLLENEQREKVSPFEEADALVELVSHKKVPKAHVAKSLGRDPSWISMRLKLAKASSVIRALSKDGFVDDVRTLYELKKLEDELPQVANEFIRKVRTNRVQGAYRQAIKRAKDNWHKKELAEDQKLEAIKIESVSLLDKGELCLKAANEHAGHRYTFSFSDEAFKQLKSLLLDE